MAAFIREHVTPFFYQQEKESRHHDAIVNQTIGEGLQAFKLEKLSRYERHLHRKFDNAAQAQSLQKRSCGMKNSVFASTSRKLLVAVKKRVNMAVQRRFG